MTFSGDYRFAGNGMSIDGAVNVNDRNLSLVSTEGTVLNGPLQGTGTVNAASPGASFIGGGSFSGVIEGYASVSGLYPNASFHGSWLAGTGSLGPVNAGEISLESHGCLLCIALTPFRSCAVPERRWWSPDRNFGLVVS